MEAPSPQPQAGADELRILADIESSVVDVERILHGVKLLQAIDAGVLDQVVGSWLYDQSAITEASLVGIAVDGKALRGARQPDDKRTFLFAGMLHANGAVVAQTEVDGKTNEIKAMRPLFDGRESLAGTVVTADAMHAQRDHAEFIVDERGGGYLSG